MIVVPTIPHTGTHFMRYHLLVDHHNLVEHIWPKQVDLWWPMFKNNPILVPLRDPWQVAMSWKKRAHLPGALQLEELPIWWRLLIDVIDPLRPYYLPIDQPMVRDRCLERINSQLGLNLATDWPVIRETDGSAGSHYDIVALEPWEHELAVLDVVEDNPQFFGRWYPPARPLAELICLNMST